MLNWQWEDKIGECIVDGYDGKEVKFSLYAGNAMVICIFLNDADNTYSLSWFINDKEHLKRMLGTAKGCTENVFLRFRVKELSLNVSQKESRDFATELVKSKTPIRLNLYTE